MAPQVAKLEMKDKRLNVKNRYRGTVRGKKKTLNPSIIPQTTAPINVFLKQTMLSNNEFLRISFSERDTVVSKG
ncbi:hypothetical protein [Clostridium chromiireducens]|uniref:hypothetical protein n=1 Tax=Clostridium chromiireducens TaxID=225345 RepID=UPI0028A2AB36|nr:hypothetical protein [Clostridium chromiireducens]